MQLDTTRFGLIEVADEQVINFTQPIIGFPERRRFVILPGPSGSMVKWLQATDAGDLAFLMMDPRLVLPTYEVRLAPEELAELAVASPSELEVYTLVVVPPDRTQVRTNLKAPILINPRHRLGKQTVLERSDYPLQYFLARMQRASDTPREVLHARSDT